MNITPRAQALRDLKPLEAAHFTGKADLRLQLKPSPPLSTTASLIRFETGVRNHWQAHAGGQLLHIIEGVGWVQARGADAQRISVGDSVAVNIGETRWLEESPRLRIDSVLSVETQLLLA